MAALARIEKFETIEGMQFFLRGGLFTSTTVVAANPPPQNRTVQGGVLNLVGQTITFAAPAATVTFAPATLGAGEVRDPNILLLKDIKAQVEAVSASIQVRTIDGRLGFIEATPTNGIHLAALNEPARTLLGLPNNINIQTHVYGPPGTTTPAFEWAYNVNVSGMHVVFVWE